MNSKLRNTTAAIVVAAGLAGCGAAIIIPYVLVKSIEDTIVEIGKLIHGPTGTEDIRKEVQRVKDLIEKHRQPDGSLNIPKEDSEAISQEVDRLKDKNEEMEKGLDKVEKMLKEGLEKAKKEAGK